MMSNTFILVDEALLSRLKEFVIKEISLTHTLQDQSASTRPKRVGHPAFRLTKEKRSVAYGHPEGMGYPVDRCSEGVGYPVCRVPGRAGSPVLSYLDRIVSLTPWFPKRTGHLACRHPERMGYPTWVSWEVRASDKSHPEGTEYPVFSLACRHAEMMGVQPERSSRGWSP